MRRSVPAMFFLDNKLYKKIKLVKSDDSVVVFDYEEESRVWLPVKAVLKNYKRAYSLPQVANLLSVKTNVVKEVIGKQRVGSPVLSYNPKTFAPIKYYVSEEDLMDIRDAVWELLPKNRYGEPFNDIVPSADDLRAKLFGEDDRNYVIRDNEFIQIFSI